LEWKKIRPTLYRAS